MEKKASGSEATSKKDGSEADKDHVNPQIPENSAIGEAAAVNPSAPRTARRSLSASRRSARTARSVSSESSVEVPPSGSASSQGISVVPEMKSGRATSSSAQNTKAILDMLVALVGTTPERKSIMPSEQQTPKTSLNTAKDAEQGSVCAVAAPNENASPRSNTDPGPRTNPLSALSSRTAKSIRTSAQNTPKGEAASAENPLSALSSRTAQSINSSNRTTPKRPSVERGRPLSALSSRTARSIDSSMQTTPKRTAVERDHPLSALTSRTARSIDSSMQTTPKRTAVERDRPLSALSSTRTAKSIRTSQQNTPKMESAPQINPLSALSSKTAKSIKSSGQNTPNVEAAPRTNPLSALSSKTAKSIQSSEQNTPKVEAASRTNPLSALSSRTAKSIRSSGQTTPKVEAAPRTNPLSALSSRTAKSIRSSGQSTPKMVSHQPTIPSEDLVLPHSVVTPHTPQPVARLSTAPRSLISSSTLTTNANTVIEKVRTEAPAAQPNTELNRMIVRDLRAGMLFGRSVIDGAEQSYFERDAGRVYEMNGQTEQTARSDTVIEKKAEKVVTKVERESSPAPSTAIEDADVVNITTRKEDGSLKVELSVSVRVADGASSEGMRTDQVIVNGKEAFKQSS